jgi:hypothetical protein
VKKAWLVLLGVSLLLLPVSATDGATSGRQKPYVLTAVANIGTVYWRYDCVHYRSPEWSLGIQVFRNTATTIANFRGGNLRRRRTVQPGEPTLWFPFRRERVQSLSLVQATEPGTLRARVTVDWRGNHCESYFPPRVSMQLQPRG